MSQAGPASAGSGGFVPPLSVPLGGTGNVSLTAHSLLVGEGIAAINPLGAATNGQIPIGSTGADPVLATITAGAGIAVTNGAGTITIAATGSYNLTVTPVTSAMSPYSVNAVTDQYLAVNTTGGPVTISLPNAPSAGKVFTIKDSNGNSAVNAITVTTVGGTELIDAAATYTINAPYEAINVVYNNNAPTHYEVY